MTNFIEHAPRTPWPDNFPDVVSFCNTSDRDHLRSYHWAKYKKDPRQAEILMGDIAKRKDFTATINKLKDLSATKNVIIVPIHSIELKSKDRKNTIAGSNPIPLQMALTISDHTGWGIDTDIVQKNIAGHTGANNFTRFAYPTLFDGKVKEGQQYLIVDDHVSMGGTVANCRGHIEQNGGKVIGISSLTTTRSGVCVRLSSRSKNTLSNSENFSTMGCHLGLFEKILGYDLDCLTNPEATQIIYTIKSKRENNSKYCLQSFFDDVIESRNKTKLEVLKQNKLGYMIQRFVTPLTEALKFRRHHA